MDVQVDEGVLERAVQVLEAFERPATSLSVSEISRRTGIPMTSTHRLVARMVHLGLLERAEARLVRVGLRMWELGWRSSSLLLLREVARPVMEEMHAQVNQHTQLSVLDGSDVLYVERLSARTGDTTANITRIGGRLPVHTCASGHVLLAFSPREAVGAALSGPLARFTAETVTDVDQLRRLIADARSARYATVRGTVHAESAGVAAPVFVPDGGIAAALSLIIPNRPGDVAAAIPLVLQSARRITDGLVGASRSGGVPTTISARSRASAH